MNNTRSISILTLGALAAAVLWLGFAGTVANATEKESNATAAFARLKSLSGTWEATSQKGKMTTTYEVIANGSSLVETFKMPGEDDAVLINRQALHAFRLRFPHPRLGRWMEFEAPLQEDLTGLLEALRRWRK